MAHKYDNEKGFLIIKTENLSEALVLGGIAICDSCNKSSFTGYYIAVLNRWYCDKCFVSWYKMAKRYSEDTIIEEYNFKRVSSLFDLQTHISLK